MEMKSRIDDESEGHVSSVHEYNSKLLTDEKLLSNELNVIKCQIVKAKKQNNTVDPIKNIIIINNRQPSERMKLSKTKKFIIFSVASIAIIIGVVLGNFWGKIFNAILESALVLTPTSRSYSIWKETPIPMYLKIYLFNWTNTKEFIDHNAKPHFDELGPYVFREVDYKINHIWNDNGTVTFNQMKLWHYEESMSNGFLNDTITNLNPVAVSVGYKMRHKRALAMLIGILLSQLKENFIVTKTVREILFDGYDDKLLSVAHALNSTAFPTTKFGWFYGRNGSETYDGVFNILTGSKNLLNLGILQEWNYNNKSNIYSGACSNIDGSLGDLLPPLVHNDTLPVFASDICTLIHLKYSDTIDYDGVPGKRFISTAEIFDNGTNVPSRSCYCDNIECQPSGTLNISVCKFGAPAFMSLPHFYLADESYLNGVSGLKPDKDKHEFSLAMQPDIGMPLQVQARMQFNLLMQPIKHIKMFENLPKIYMPIMWFAQEANLTISFANQIKFLLIVPLLGHVTLYGIAGIGVLVFFIGICLVIRERRKSDDIQNLISKADDNGAVNTDG